jgi:hypothetical protein
MWKLNSTCVSQTVMMMSQLKRTVCQNLIVVHNQVKESHQLVYSKQPYWSIFMLKKVLQGSHSQQGIIFLCQNNFGTWATRLSNLGIISKKSVLQKFFFRLPAHMNLMECLGTGLPSARPHDFDGMLGTGLPVSMYTTKPLIDLCRFNVRFST